MSEDRPEGDLFDFCVVANLQEDHEKTVPMVSYRFPPKTEANAKKGKDMTQSIPLFCYPDLQSLKKSTSYASETFSFVMTDATGGKRFGYCRRMLPPGRGPRYPESYCIISFYPCFDLFFQILDVVEARRRSSEKDVAVFSFLKAVLAHVFPLPGDSFLVRVYSPGGRDGISEVKLSREDDFSDSTLKYVSFAPLFRCLAPCHIVAIFVSLCYERRVIFMADTLTKLSSCVLALIALLYPFSWQHIMIPLLPESMLNYVCAPMPFVIGVLSSLSKELDKLPLEDVVRVDVDKSDVFILPSDAPMLQLKPIKNLQESLEHTVKSVDKDSPDFNKEISSAFLRFFLGLFGNYPKFMKGGKVKDGAEHRFDSPGFKRSLKGDERKFMNYFEMSQMVEQFILEREKSVSADAGGIFESAVKNPSLLRSGNLLRNASEKKNDQAKVEAKSLDKGKGKGKSKKGEKTRVDDTSMTAVSGTIGQWENQIQSSSVPERSSSVDSSTRSTGNRGSLKTARPGSASFLNSTVTTSSSSSTDASLKKLQKKKGVTNKKVAGYENLVKGANATGGSVKKK